MARLTDAQWNATAEAIRDRTAVLLGFFCPPGWSVTVEATSVVGADRHFGACSEVEYDRDYLTATIRVFVEEVANFDAEELDETIIHEIVHLHLADIIELAEKSSTEAAVLRAEERCVASLTHAMKQVSDLIGNYPEGEDECCTPQTATVGTEIESHTTTSETSTTSKSTKAMMAAAGGTSRSMRQKRGIQQKSARRLPMRRSSSGQQPRSG